MSPETRRPLTGDELRMWLNDRRGHEVTLSVQLDGVPGPIFNTKGELSYSSGSFDPAWLNENPDIASGYAIGPGVLGVDDLDRFGAVLVTAPEYGNVELVEVRLADTVLLTIGDPF
jgi:hypothetical protein